MWNGHSKGFFLATRPCSPFLFKYLFTVYLIIAEKPVFRPKWIVVFFFVFQQIFLAVVAEILVGLPDCGLVSPELIIFIFKSLDIFFYHFTDINNLFLQYLRQLFYFPHGSVSSKFRAALDELTLIIYTQTLITIKEVTGVDINPSHQGQHSRYVNF